MLTSDIDLQLRESYSEFTMIAKARICRSSDDPDEQTAVTLGYRYLVTRLQRWAGPILLNNVATGLSVLNEVNNLYSAFDADLELNALLPEIKGAIDSLEIQ